MYGKYYTIAEQISSNITDDEIQKIVGILFGGDNNFNQLCSNLYDFARDAYPAEIVECMVGGYFLGYLIHQIYVDDTEKFSHI